MSTFTSPGGLSGPHTLLDEETGASSDPLAGMMVGSCEIVGSLLPGRPGALLAFKLDLAGASEVVLLRKLDGAGELPASLVADAEEAASFQDSHLERVLGIETSAEGSFWVSNYVPGASLEELRDACKQKGMAVPMGLALAAVADVALGLQHMHGRQSAREPLRRCAHGLLRPQNIVVTFAGPARLLNPRYLRLTPNGSVDAEPLAGNAGYLSPEVIRGELPDPRSDVFSLAVLVHETLTGRPLFNGRTPRERADATSRGAQVAPSRLNPSISQQIDEVVMKALSLEPNQRFAAAGQFHRAFKSAAGPYMWKESQRIELMERLFPTRARRTRELDLLMKEREAAAIARIEDEKRAVEQARLAAEAAEREAARLAQQQAQEARLAQQRAAEAAKASAAPVRSAAQPAAARPVWVVAAAGALVVVAVAVGAWLMFRSPPAEPAPVVALPLPAPALDGGQTEADDAGTERSDDGGATAALDAPDASTGADGGLDGGAPAAPKKKKKSSVVIPPWLRR